MYSPVEVVVGDLSPPTREVRVGNTRANRAEISGFHSRMLVNESDPLLAGPTMRDF